MIEHQNVLNAELGLSDLINAFSSAVFVKDRGHRCVMLNDECCRALGRARKDVVGKTEYDILPKKEAEEIWKTEEELFEKGGEKREEDSITDRKGVTRVYSTTRTVFTDRAGRSWLVGAWSDITGHKEVLEEFRFMASLLEAQNEASIAGILVVDDAGRILTANRRFREMWGIPPELLLSKSDSKALRSVLGQLVDPEGFRKKVEHLYKHRDEKSRDEIALKDGRIFDRYSSPVVGKDGEYYGRVWQFRDVTDVRKVAALKAEVEHRRELDSLKDKFIGTVSHELRTPLTIVRTAVDSLRAGLAGPLTPKQQELAELCQRNALRLTKMINNLLDISRLESGKAKAHLRRLDLKTLLADMDANFRMLPRGRELSIRIDAPADLPEVRGDPDLIGEVFLNLLDNAARYARSKVHVRIKRERRNAPGREVDGVRVDVVDDGPGIPGDKAGSLFSKFCQVGRTEGAGYKGTGLGLAICKEILCMHGSEIAVESAPGKETRFHFFLPEWTPSVRRHSAAGRARS